MTVLLRALAMSIVLFLVERVVPASTAPMPSASAAARRISVIEEGSARDFAQRAVCMHLSCVRHTYLCLYACVHA